MNWLRIKELMLYELLYLVNHVFFYIMANWQRQRDTLSHVLLGRCNVLAYLVVTLKHVTFLNIAADHVGPFVAAGFLDGDSLFQGNSASCHTAHRSRCFFDLQIPHIPLWSSKCGMCWKYRSPPQNLGDLKDLLWKSPSGVSFMPGRDKAVFVA